MITSAAFAGLSYHVLGLARTGLSVVEALLASGAEVAAWDSREEARAALPAGVSLADPMETDLSGYHALVISPGVPLNTHPLSARAAAAGTPIIGDVELFAQARAGLPPHKVVGITGTNGKSTVTALIHHVLRAAGVPTSMGGNIGLPILSQDPLPVGGVHVLELSSYQIDLTRTLACEVAMLLNISPDHLDRYDGSMDKYAASKARLFEMQYGAGSAVISGADQWSAAIRAAHAERMAALTGDLLDQQESWPALQGPHNRQNAAASIAALRRLDIADAAILAGFESFPGLPHRMERIGVRGGIAYVNDSKATNPESAAPALAAFAPIHWILGGKVKGADLDACMPYLDRVAAAYLIGEGGPVFGNVLRGRVPELVQAGTLENAVKIASAKASPGDTVLLSPAAASFDQFRDFEERGDIFRALVERLPA
ncbi:UDP-N-acetylmuramoyl-L-alanine--D-glutamate ligase [Pacificimonas sp. WHA3]|uniref:UDP-N-acetylmuramoylalanine--D-glutamate ligase n=1 Tax=Pacificimonas pallii TaxID=2827236 RepID=A0ABS6SFN3_9SPHN|nr:UDP-N-acetylmuramoyl-L-alanine--D-glutamate ligase [Pacificimonas pallii]MBV7257212.1 UDP-N-acetylmuramoyl-L-alanine--D-glutamate ligase [Pacificimonas pallii]